MKSKLSLFLSGWTVLSMSSLIMLMTFVSSCVTDPEPEVLTVTTSAATNVTETQATLGGVVVSDGGLTVTERGIAVSLDPDPTIDDLVNDQALPIGSGTGSFSDTFDGFPSGTIVHVRAYATNSGGTAYGEDLTFTTLESSNGILITTATPTGVTSTNATLGGNITTDGGSAVTARGVVVSLQLNPTIDDPTNDEVLPIGSGTGIFSDDFTGFPSNTIIHVRAFATNSKGTVYGEDKVFTTLETSAGCPIVTVASNITTNTTWNSGKVYVVNGIIQVTATLTIEAGAVIKINGGSIDINSGGRIIANGTEANRIVFTSYSDDTYCGDSNNDGSATVAQKGDWQMIFLNGGNNTFKYCDFFYAGKNRSGRNNAVEISVAGSQFTFDHCTFAHTLSSASSTAYVIFGQSYMNDASVSVFTNNAFYDNDRPIYLDVNYTMNPNNIFHNPANPSQKNLRNGIFLNGGSITDHTTTWAVTEVPYVLYGSCRAHVGSQLNIGANAVVKFLSTDGELLSTNTVSLHSTAFLTSWKDDTKGGDSNGDGNASAPAKGDWYGFADNSTNFWVYKSGANILYPSKP
jgi:hypothetical protein